jgi:hypothetical protein
MNAEFLSLVQKAVEIHKAKEHDYTSHNPDENFMRQAIIMDWFNDPVDKAFVSMIGVKLARLSTLLNGKSPKNESIEDSFLDLFNYVGLWGANYMRRKK